MKTICIITFAFGVPNTIRSNRRIAQIASKKARELDAPVFTQLDIRIEPGIRVIHTDEMTGHPPPTLRIARDAVQWAKEQGFKELLIIAAQPHLWRALRDVREAIREIGGGISIYACQEIKQYHEDSWYCLNSTQLRTRSRKGWQSREYVLKLLPFFIYKRVAS